MLVIFIVTRQSIVFYKNGRAGNIRTTDCPSIETYVDIIENYGFFAIMLIFFFHRFQLLALDGYAEQSTNGCDDINN